jgi:hypothetical protein
MRAKKASSVGLLHRGSQVMRAKKASNVGQRTIRSNLHAICGSARAKLRSLAVCQGADPEAPDANPAEWELSHEGL